MSDARFTIDVEGNVFKALDNIRKDTDKLKKGVTGIEESSKKAFSGMKRHIQNISFVSITQGLENVTQSLSDIAGPGMRFESSMAELSAITGLTGDALDELGAKARANAKEFGGDAAASVETFKLLLSQLGPDLAKTPETLDAMAKNSERLAKTMGGDVVGATNVLTTAMNQYNVDLSNTTEANEVMNDMMNSMAASAKAGSSELPVLQAAVKNVGGDAMRANIPFEQMLSSIQLLDKAGKKGAEGGIALRNVISTLNQGRFLPKDVQEELTAAGVNIDALSDKSLSFTDRLRQLEGVQSDAALMSKLFGRETAGAAQALLQSVDAQDEMTNAITGTNTANEQAAVIMETAAEKQARFKAQIDDFKVSIFNATGGVFGYLEPISDVARQLSAFVPITSAAAQGFTALRKSKVAGAIATKAITAAQWLWNAAMTANPIGLLIAGVAGLAAGAYALTRAFDSSTSAQKAANAVQKRAIDLASDEIVESKVLTETIKNAKEGTEERTRAINELRKAYPDLLSKYKDEELTNERINALQQEIADNAMKRAEKEAAAEIYKEKVKERIKAAQEGPSTWDEVWAFSKRAALGVATLGSSEVFGYADKVVDSAEQDHQQYVDSLKEQEDAALGEHLKRSGNIQDIARGSRPASAGIDMSTGGSAIPTGSGATVPTRDKVIQGTGGEMKTINVRIENLVKNITLSTTNLKEGSGKIKQQVTEAMIAAVRDFEVAM